MMLRKGLSELLTAFQEQMKSIFLRAAEKMDGVFHLLIAGRAVWIGDLMLLKKSFVQGQDVVEEFDTEEALGQRKGVRHGFVDIPMYLLKLMVSPIVFVLEVCQ